MSYNASIPVSTTSPSLFPALAQTNWSRLQTILGADHQFNLPPAANDGYHNLVHMQIPATIPTVGIASTGQFFTDTVSSNNQLFFLSSNSRKYQLTPGIVAAVNFEGLGANSTNQVINSQINVSSVFKNGTGDYTINFTTTLNTNYPVVSVIGARDSSDAPCKPMLRGTGTATNTLSDSLVRIQFSGGTNSLDDVRIGCVIVYSMI